MMNEIQIADFALPLLTEKYRYKVLYGGRGSAKSYSVADVLLIKGARERRRVLCAREFQNSISDSVLQLLRERIKALGLENHYETTNTSITGKNGTEFFFKGVRHNVQSVKSTQGITDLWVEEAHTVSKNSWDVLIPTIREPNSEIYVTFNPDDENDPTYKKFITEGPPPNTYIQKVNWYDNPWFPDVLRAEMDHMYETNPELAEHVWEGQCRSQSDAQIFKGKYRVDYFDIDNNWEGPYFGQDFGFSNDPAAVTKFWIDLDNKKIFIRNEMHKKGIDLDDLPTFMDKIPGIRKHMIRADNSRPETISYLKRQGFQIEAAKKWAGSVEDGIEFIKSFKEVVIHPECKATIREFKNYSYKVDRLTQDVTSKIVDDWNHIIDAIRYALEPMITRSIAKWTSGMNRRSKTYATIGGDEW